MKGLFNKSLVLALLVSVSGVNASPDGFVFSTIKLAVPALVEVKPSLVPALVPGDMTGMQLLGAAAKQLSKEAKDAAVVGLEFTKKNINEIASGLVDGTRAVSAKMAPVITQQTEAIKHLVNEFGSGVKVAGLAAKNGVSSAVEFSKPYAASALGYALRARNIAASFYANHTLECKTAALAAAYFAFVYYIATKQMNAQKEQEKETQTDVRYNDEHCYYKPCYYNQLA